MSRVVDQAALTQAVELALRQHLKTADLPAKELDRVRGELLAYVGSAERGATLAEGDFLKMLTEAIDNAVTALESREANSRS